MSPTEAKSKINPLIGTCKASLSKSQRHPNHEFQSATLNFEAADDALLLNFSGVNASGEPESGTRKLPLDGMEHPVPEAPGVVAVAKWLDPLTLEMVARKDGTVVGQASYRVSANGETLTATVKGTDGNGLGFEQVIVFDRQ